MTSYDPALEHADLDREIQRLKAQLDLTWTHEARLISAMGLREGMNVVDLGCGPGHALSRLQTLIPTSQIVGVEQDPIFAAIAETGLRRSAGITVLNRSAADTGLQSAATDFVIARFLYQHLEDPLGVTREAYRILKPGGVLVVIDIDQAIWGLTDPPIPELVLVMQRYAAAHATAGRDRSIGRRLLRILRHAGFQGLRLEVVAAHSDDLGLAPFFTQLDLGRVSSLVEAGAVSIAELESAKRARDAFFAAPDSIIMTLNLVVCGRKPDL